MLQDLGQEDLKTFQWHLQDHEFLGGFQEIKKIKLEKADTRETVDVMINTYTSKHAVDVAKLILQKMHLNEGESEEEKCIIPSAAKVSNLFYNMCLQIFLLLSLYIMCFSHSAHSIYGVDNNTFEKLITSL